MSAADPLALAASRLSRAAPAAWDEFISAFHTYSQSIKDECVQAPVANLPTAQGRAQQSVRIYEVLKNCQATAAKVVAGQANNQRRP